MNSTNISEFILIMLPPFFLACIFTAAGSLWIDRLYRQEKDDSLLSFPDQIAKRAKYRKPLLFFLLLFCLGKTWCSVSIPTVLYYTAAIAFLSFITVTDFEQYVIFDSMLLPLAALGLCYTLHQHLSITEHLAAGLGAGLLFLLLTVLTKGAIGGGDIKLIAALGLWSGIRPLLSVIMYGFLAGGAAALFLLVTKQKKRQDYFAYGPYFALSGIAVLLSWIRPLL